MKISSSIRKTVGPHLWLILWNPTPWMPKVYYKGVKPFDFTLYWFWLISTFLWDAFKGNIVFLFPECLFIYFGTFGDGTFLTNGPSIKPYSSKTVIWDLVRDSSLDRDYESNFYFDWFSILFFYSSSAFFNFFAREEHYIDFKEIDLFILNIWPDRVLSLRSLLN